MANLIPIQQNIDFSEVMTSAEVAKLLRSSAQTVRALTLRKHHPLPSINTGMCTRRQRIFLRPSVLRWLREEEKLSKTAQPEDGDDRAEQAS